MQVETERTLIAVAFVGLVALGIWLSAPYPVNVIWLGGLAVTEVTVVVLAPRFPNRRPGVLGAAVALPVALVAVVLSEVLR